MLSIGGRQQICLPVPHSRATHFFAIDRKYISKLRLSWIISTAGQILTLPISSFPHGPAQFLPSSPGQLQLLLASIPSLAAHCPSLKDATANQQSINRSVCRTQQLPVLFLHIFCTGLHCSWRLLFLINIATDARSHFKSWGQAYSVCDALCLYGHKRTSLFDLIWFSLSHKRKG